MRNMYVGFSRSSIKFPVFSKIIQWYLGTSFSHTYIRFYSDTLNRNIIYESAGGGVKFVGSREWKKRNYSVVEFSVPIKEELYVDLMRQLIDYAGIEYGFWQNIGVAISDFLRLRENPIKKGKNCSELVSEVLIKLGFSVPKEPNLMTPKDVFDLLNSKALERVDADN